MLNLPTNGNLSNSANLKKPSKKNPNLSFGRAFTTAEKTEYKDIIAKSREKLGTNNTSMILFDVSFPQAKGENTGIGSSFSKSAENFLKFMKDMTGINTIQLGPQGNITKSNVSPFSGSVFATGEHVIDLKKLTTKEYNSILPKEDFNKALVNTDETKAQYDSVLGEDGTQATALKTAFENFKTLSADAPIKKEFKQFEQDNADWLERDNLYSALSEKHGNDYWKSWGDELDRNLFSGEHPQEQVDARISELKDNHKNAMEFNSFTQFIADKQQQESKATLSKAGIKLSGDCLVGFSPKENWAYQSAFGKDEYFGCPGGNGPVTWGLPAIDMSKVGEADNLGESGKLLQKKFDSFFKKYDGSRIDAAWQLVKPYIYEETKDGPVVKDKGYLGDKILKIMDNSAKKVLGKNYKPENLNLELLGGPVDMKDPIFKNRVQIQHSIWQKPGWGSVNFYKEKGLSDKEFVFGLGTHDDSTLAQVTKEKTKEQAPVLAKNLKFDEKTLLNNPKEFMKAKFAEIFTARNNFFTAFDALGIDKRFNTGGIDSNNWSARVPQNYEEVYHSNLVKGTALNTPDAMLLAMKAKGVEDKKLQSKLATAAQILKEDGPMTEKESNEALGQDFSNL